MSGRRAVLTLLTVVLALDVVGIGWALPHTVAPQPDDVAKPALESMRQGFVGPSKYPKLHQLTLAAAYAPYLGWLWASGDLDLGGGSVAEAGAQSLADPGGTISTLILVARGVSVAMHLACVALVFAAARRMAPPGIALAASALLGFAPVVALFARGTWVDVPMLFWFAAAVLAWLAAADEPSRRRLLRFAVLATLAVCTKEQIAFALAPMAGHLALVAWRGRAASGAGGSPARSADASTRRSATDLAVAALAGLALFALLNDWLWAPSLWLDRMAWWGAEMERYRSLTGGRAGAAALVRGFLDGFVSTGGPALAALTALAASSLLVRPTRRGALLLLMMLAYPVLLGAWLGFTQPRYAMPSVLLGCLLVAQQAAALATLRRTVAALLGLGVAFQLAHGAQVAWALTGEPRSQAAAWLDARLADGAAVEVYQDEEELPGLRAIGLRPAPSRDLSAAGLAARRPAAVVVTSADHWRLSPAQRAWIDGLGGPSGVPPGYEIVRFGPAAGGRMPLFVDASSRDRLWPEVVVLIRSD